MVKTANIVMTSSSYYDVDNGADKAGGVSHTVQRALLIAIFICKKSKFSTALSSGWLLATETSIL